MIHFIWLGKEIPFKYQNNINTFTKTNPDYEVSLKMDYSYPADLSDVWNKVVLWTEIINEQIKKNLTETSVRDLKKWVFYEIVANCFCILSSDTGPCWYLREVDNYETKDLYENESNVGAAADILKYEVS